MLRLDEFPLSPAWWSALALGTLDVAATSFPSEPRRRPPIEV